MPPNTVIKKLSPDDCRPDLLSHFNRYQEVRRCWRKVDGAWVLKDSAFVEQWDEAEKARVAAVLRQGAEAGDSVLALYHEEKLKAFSRVEKPLFGSRKEYVNLDLLHVSHDCRRQGFGRMLFAESCGEARNFGAGKLYISAHSSEESQAFYRGTGCKEAAEINETLFKIEPFDVHMEYCL